MTIGVFSLNSFAANPYTDCGIGAALFPNTNWAAVTSNATWDAGTTAVISATASEDTCSGGESLGQIFRNAEMCVENVRIN